MPDMQRVYVKSPDIVSRKIAGKTVLVPVRHDVGDLTCIYNLNEVGGRVWELIDGGMTLGDIRDTIIKEYQVTPEEAEVDIMEFLTRLEQMGAVSAINSGVNNGE